MRRGIWQKKRLTPECVRGEALSYVPRFHPACQRRTDARQDNRNTRTNKRSGKCPAAGRHSVEQLAAAEGAQRQSGRLRLPRQRKAPARSSRAAREWYGRSACRGRFHRVCPSLSAAVPGSSPVKANLNGPTISLRGRKVKSPLYPGARGRPRGPPLPGWRLYRIPRNTRHCRGGACPRPRAAYTRPPLPAGVYQVPRDTRCCEAGLNPPAGGHEGRPTLNRYIGFPRIRGK